MNRTNALLAVFVVFAFLQATQAVTIEVFTKPDCNPCEKALEYLDKITEGMSDVEIVDYNSSYLGGSDFGYFNQTAARVGFSTDHVPVIVAGRDYTRGFINEEKSGKIITAIVANARSRGATTNPQVSGPGESKPPTSEVKIVLKMFWGKGCSHCAAAEDFLEEISPKYPELVIKSYEINYNETNRMMLIRTADEMGFTVGSIPVIVIDCWYHIGYESDEIDGLAIENAINQRTAALEGRETNATNETCSFVADLGFFGKADLREMGIPLSTAVIGFMDGFNPCAFFVLTMLLSFMVYARSRSRMLAIGLTFVFVSGFVYFLFMTALFSAIRAINEIRLVALVAGCIALTMGAINLKDFFFFGKGFSLSIPEDKKPKLYKRMRGLLKSQSMVKILVGTIVLAFVANSYELLCTSGFPVVYGTLLHSQGLDTVTSLLYIALYNVFYIIPLLVIVLIFVKSLGGRKLSEAQGELLKAISGFMMLGFGIMLIVDPMALRNVFVAVALIGFSVIISLVLAKLKKRSKGKAAEPPKEKKVPKRKNKNVCAKKPKL